MKLTPKEKADIRLKEEAWWLFHVFNDAEFERRKKRGLANACMKGVTLKIARNIIHKALKEQAKQIFEEINSGYFEKLLLTKEAFDSERDYKILLQHLIKIQDKWLK